MSANARPRIAFTQPLLAACALLLVVLAWLWLAPGLPAKWRRWQPPAPQAPALDDVEQARLHFNPAAGNASAQVLARPLFMHTRRPAPARPAASGAEDAKPAQPIDQARVLGLLDGPQLTGALIEYEGQAQLVRVGESIGGWRITGLQDRSVRIERRGERRTLELPFLGEVDGPAAPNAPNTPNASPVRKAAPPAVPVSEPASASESSASEPSALPTASAEAAAASAPATPASAPASRRVGVAGAAFGGRAKPSSADRKPEGPKQ